MQTARKHRRSAAVERMLTARQDLSSGLHSFVAIPIAQTMAELPAPSLQCPLHLQRLRHRYSRHDATFQINGSDSAVASRCYRHHTVAPITSGGTFEGFMDGSGTMTFNNATIHADTREGRWCLAQTAPCASAAAASLGQHAPASLCSRKQWHGRFCRERHA